MKGSSIPNLMRGGERCHDQNGKVARVHIGQMPLLRSVSLGSSLVLNTAW